MKTLRYPSPALPELRLTPNTHTQATTVLSLSEILLEFHYVDTSKYSYFLLF